MLRNFRRSLGLAANAGPGDGNKKEAKRGLVVGELLIAVVLLAVAISSLTALMYSVTRNPRTRSEAAVECTEKGSATSPKCATAPKAATASKLLVSGCATRSGASIQACNDSVQTAQTSDATTLRSRTDSASLEKLPRKTTRKQRTDLGFIR
jgi:hypothetical protein